MSRKGRTGKVCKVVSDIAIFRLLTKRTLLIADVVFGPNLQGAKHKLQPHQVKKTVSKVKKGQF